MADGVRYRDLFNKMSWFSSLLPGKCPECACGAGKCPFQDRLHPSAPGTPPPRAEGKIALVGNPNVGKSLMFNKLTASYAVVSNYPGTSVDVCRGRTEIGGRAYEVIDTPGMYSLHPLTEEEKVARRILMDENIDVIVNVVDAKNLERMLPLTLQLLEAGLPVVLAVNMIDEAERLGRGISAVRLEERLKIPVVLTACAVGRGVDVLRGRIESYANR